MKKITKIVKTSVFIEDIDFEDQGVTHSFLKVVHKKNSFLILRKGLPKNFDSLSEAKQVDTVLNPDSKYIFKVATNSFLNKIRTIDNTDVLYKTFDDRKDFHEINLDSVKEAFHEGRIININNYHYNHLFVVYGDFAPILATTKLSYMGGTPLSNYHIKWENKKELIKHLRNNPSVVSVEEKEIPYYNKDKNCDRYLEITIQPKKDCSEKLWKEVKQLNPEDPERFFKQSLTMQEMTYNPKVIDFFNIKPYLRTKDELKELENEDSEY